MGPSHDTETRLFQDGWHFRWVWETVPILRTGMLAHSQTLGWREGAHVLGHIGKGDSNELATARFPLHIERLGLVHAIPRLMPLFLPSNT